MRELASKYGIFPDFEVSFAPGQLKSLGTDAFVAFTSISPNNLVLLVDEYAMKV